MENKHFWQFREQVFFAIYRKCPLAKVQDCSVDLIRKRNFADMSSLRIQQGLFLNIFIFIFFFSIMIKQI